MFAFIFTAFNSFISKPREGRQALIYENYIRTGEGVPSNRIYCESLEDKRVRKKIAAIRYNDRLRQQVKLVRLMKKLLIKVNEDDELEQMRKKIDQIELKIEKAARENDVNCDDIYDIQLEKLILSDITTTIAEQSIYNIQASGDHHINSLWLCGDSKEK